MLRTALLIAGALSLPLAQDAEPYLKDSDLKKLAGALSDYIEASIAQQKVLEAESDVQEQMDKLGKKLRKAPVRDVLGSPADLGRALWLSYEYGKARVKGGSVEDKEALQGPFTKSNPLKYTMLAPAGYDKGKSKSWPLILCIPDEGESPREHLLQNWEDSGLRDQVILACPEMPAESADWLGTPGVATALILFRTIYEEWAIDFDEVYLAGRGAGVEAALSIAGKFPERFAGVIGRSGDAGSADPANFSNVATWFAGGGAGVTAWAEKIEELEFTNCTVSADGREPEILAWMDGVSRPSVPEKVVLVPGRPFPTRSYWIQVEAGDEEGARVEATVDRASNTITIEADVVPRVTVLFNDDLVDLSKPVKVIVNGVENEDQLPRSFRTCLSLIFRGTSDPGRVFVASRTYSVPARAAK